MKKLLKPLAFLIAAATIAGSAWADSWGYYGTDRSWIGIDAGGGSAAYSLDGTGSPAFQDADLGTITQGDSLTIVSYDTKTWKNGADISACQYYYKINDGEDVSIGGRWLEDIGWNGDQKWGNDAVNADVAAGLAPGTYTLSIHGKITGSTDPAGDIWEPSETTYYSATFTVAAPTVTFSVVVPEHTVVTVTDATLVSGNTYQTESGTAVTISYAAAGAYVATGTMSQTVTPANGDTIAAPADYATTPAEVEYTNASGAVTYKLASSLNSLDTGTYKLLADVTVTMRMTFGTFASSVTFDLNGHTLTSTASDYAFNIPRNGSAASPKTFSLVDTSAAQGGSLVFTTTPTTGTAAIRVYGNYNQVTIGEGVTVSGGSIAMLKQNQTLTVNGTVAGGDDFAIVSNGDSTKNLTLTVAAGAVITSDTTAIYLPGTGSATIAGSVTGKTGIEIRSGSLEIVDGAVITATGEFSEAPNGSGTTVNGAAVAVSQHTTKNPIDVTVSGGTLTGDKALYETDVQNGDETTDVAMAVTGGEFVGAVESDDVTEFISGGTFDAAVPARYCATGFVPVDNGDGSYGVEVGVAKTVTFDGNGDGVVGVPETLTCYVGGVYKVGGIPSPTRENYRFRGWYTVAAHEGGERIRGHFIVEDAEPMTLYARWDHLRQVVTFNANDGGAGATLLKDEARFDVAGNYSGAAFTMKGAEWANHKFLGWYDQAVGGSPVQWGDVVTSDSSRTLYAHWRQYRQTVTFMPNADDVTLLKDTAKFDCGGNYSGAVFTMKGATRDGYKFMGWFDQETGGKRVWWGDEVTSDFDRTLYAQWRKVAAVGITGFSVAPRAKAGARSSTVTDTLTRAKTGVSSGATTYSSWTEITDASTAVYAGNSAGGGGASTDAIQLRYNNNNKNSGIVTTASGGKANKVTLVWNSNTDNARIINVYGKGSAYSSAADLSSSSATTQGDLLGTLKKGDATLLDGAYVSELDISALENEYTFIGVRSSSGALYLDSVSFVWEVAGSSPTVALTVNGNSVESGAAVTVEVGDTVTIVAAEDGFGEGTVGWSWTKDGGADATTGDTFTMVASTVNETGYNIQATARLGEQTASANVLVKVTEPAPPSVTLDPSEASVRIGAPLKITATAAHFSGDVSWSWEGNGTPSGNEFTVDTSAAGSFSVKATATCGEQTANATAAITVSEVVEFVRVTSPYALTPGEYVLIGDGPTTGTSADVGKIFAMKAVVTSTPYIDRQSDAIVLDGTSVMDPDSSIVWILAQVDDGWTIYNSAVGYVDYRTTKNTASATNTVGDKSTWTIAESGAGDGLFTVQNVADDTRYLQYNPGSPRFACYTGGQNNLALYRKKGAAKTVTFNANGDNVVLPLESLTCYVGGIYKEGGIPSPTRENYRFRGWYTVATQEGGERIRGHYVVEDAEPMTLYARWEHLRQVVTFNANDGGAGATLLKTEARFDVAGNYSGSVFTMKGAEWANHKFLGWYDQAVGGSPVQWGDVVTSDSSRTLYAHWRQYRQTVTFEAGAEDVTLLTTTAKFDCGGTYSGSVFTMKGATRDGYKFMGWYDEDTGERVWWGSDVTSDTTRTLVAHWRREAAAAITGISVSPRAVAPAARSAGADTVECTLTFSTVAGFDYDLLWTPSLLGDWEILKSWTADTDGETSVTVEIPADSPTGFFRLMQVFD